MKLHLITILITLGLLLAVGGCQGSDSDDNDDVSTAEMTPGTPGAGADSVSEEILALADESDLALTPRANFDAEYLAMEASGEMVAPQQLYERVVTELAMIREQNSEVNGEENCDLTALNCPITVRTDWSSDEPLVVGFDEEGQTKIESDTYTDWNELNQFFRMNPIQTILNSSFVILGSDAVVNIEKLSQEYAKLSHITSADPNYLAGDSNDICLSIEGEVHSYIFNEGFGDCPSGCISETYYGFSIDADGNLTQLGTWSNSESSEEPEWFRNLTACREGLR